MSTDKGYIKLYRDIWSNWLWKVKPFDKARAWIDLIMLANHEEKVIEFNEKPYTVRPGQHMTSLAALAERWGWSRNKVRRFLNALESERMLTQKRHSNGTLLTLINYRVYQGMRNSKRNTYGTDTEQRRNRGGHKQDTIQDTNTNTNKEESPSAFYEFEPSTPEEDEEGGWESK